MGDARGEGRGVEGAGKARDSLLQQRDDIQEKLQSVIDSLVEASADGDALSKELRAEFEPLTKLTKEMLGDKVEKVIVNSRMADFPCVLTILEYEWSVNMKRIMKAQALRDNSMTSYMVWEKIMEVSPKHSIISEWTRKAALCRDTSSRLRQVLPRRWQR